MPKKKPKQKEKKQTKEPKKELTISAIKEGTVIDHIGAKATFKVADILKLKDYNGEVSIATNLISKTQGRKGIVKVENKFLTENEFNKIAVVAPEATVNIIKDYTVKQKIKVRVPEHIENVIKCSNPVCITNSEKIITRFHTVEKHPIKLKCHYCERTISGDIQIL